MGLSTATRHTYLYTRIATYSGFGGLAVTNRSDPKHPATPTRPGRFIINFIGPHVTANTGPDAYIWAAVPWGTPLRRNAQGIIQVKLAGKDWQRLTTLPLWRHLDHDQSRVASDISNRSVMVWAPVITLLAKEHLAEPIRYYKEIPDTWIFNDFGHITIKYYKDVNHNGRQDSNQEESTYSDFIHTTPSNELVAWLSAKANVDINMPLGESHGCVHMLPSEVSEAIDSRYLQVGSSFVVHPYSDHRVQGVFEVTTPELRSSAKEVHFYPGVQKLVV